MKTLDTGFPVVREVVEDAVDADGTIDTTMFSGARNVTLGLQISPSVTAETRWQLTQRVKAFLNPRLRPQMFVQYSDLDPELVMTLRPANLQDALMPQRTQRFDVVAQWVCPTGILESAVQHSETITPGAGSSPAGVEFDDIEFDGVEFPLVDPPGVSEVLNAGDRDAYPIVRLYGPFGDEGNASDETTIENLTTGRSLVFAGMGVAEGDYVEIDLRRKTAYLNGVESSSNSRLKYRVFPDSQWWTLPSGTSQIAFRPDTFSGNAQAHVLWRDAHS
jgi:hypothetical protein